MSADESSAPKPVLAVRAAGAAGAPRRGLGGGMVRDPGPHRRRARRFRRERGRRRSALGLPGACDRGVPVQDRGVLRAARHRGPGRRPCRRAPAHGDADLSAAPHHLRARRAVPRRERRGRGRGQLGRLARQRPYGGERARARLARPRRAEVAGHRPAGRRGQYSARSVEAHVRPDPAGADAIDLAATVVGAAVPPLDQLLGGPEPIEADLQIRVTQARAGLRPSRSEIERWREAGGRIGLTSLTTAKGARRLEAKGELGLDELRRPIGRLEVAAAGLSNRVLYTSSFRSLLY